MAPSNFSNKSYEDRVHIKYSELEPGRSGHIIWGSSYYRGSQINVYTDEGLVKELFSQPIMKDRPKIKQLKIVDLGAAEGFVAHTIGRQLRKAGYKTELIALDRKPVEKYKDVKYISGDLKQVENLLDTMNYGVLRFVLPYFNGEEQEVLLQNLHELLPEGGKLFVLHDAAKNERLGEIYNDFLCEASAAMGSWPEAEIRKHRYWTPGAIMKKLAEGVGFHKVRVSQLTGIKSWLSPEIYATRFSMTPEQSENLKSVFEKWKKSGKLPFDKGILNRTFVYSVMEK